MKQLTHTPTDNLSTNVHGNQQNIYDINNQRKEIDKGMLIANTLKVKLNSQKTNALWLVTTIKAILKTPIQKSDNIIFSFRRTHVAAVRNSKILTAFKGDLGAAIAAQKYSSVNYGSEFRNITSLAKIFLYHKDKTKIISIIQKGYGYHLGPIEEETQISDLDAMILRGNHKSSNSVLNSAALDKSISKDIDHGWALTLTIESLQKIKNAGVVPLGVAEQFSINEKLELNIKICVTHD